MISIKKVVQSIMSCRCHIASIT